MATKASQEVAATVRAEMARKQITQDALADQLHVTQPVISRRLNGSKSFTIDELTVIAKLVGRPVTFLVKAANSVPAAPESEVAA